MSKIIDIIDNNSSKSNLSGEVLKVFLDYKKNQKKSSAYLYYNSDFYIELMMFIGLLNLKNNLSSKKNYQLSDYEIGDIVYFRNINYIFKGLKDGNVHLFNKKNACDYYLPKELFLNDNIKIKAPKRNHKSSIKESISTIFEIDNPNYKTNYQNLILTEKKNVDELKQIEVKINGKEYKFPSIVSSKYITYTGKSEYLSHTNIREKPYLIFTSDIIQAIEYVEDYKRPYNFKVFVIGGKWHKYKQSQNLHDLIEVCKELDVPLNLYSAVFSVFSFRAIKNLRKLDNVISLLEARKNLKKPFIEFKFIHTNKKLYNDVIELLDVIEDMQKKSRIDYYYIFLEKKLSNFLNLSLAQVKGSTNTLAIYKEDILKSINKVEKDLSERLSELLDNIYKNRYGFNVKRGIEEVTDEKTKTMIIVPNELVEETTNLFKKQENIKVRSYNEQIKSRMYYTYESLILINPKPFERIRWITSNLASKVYVFYPEIFLDAYSKSLKRDKIYIEELLKLDSQNKEVNIPYLKSLNYTLDKIKLKTEKNIVDSNYLSQVIDGESESFVDRNERILKEHYEKYLMELEIDESVQDKDNQKVTVFFEISLQNGHIFGTENAKVNIVNPDNYIEEKNISDIEPGDIIIEFDIPYSDEQYREKLKELCSGNLHSEKLVSLDDNVFFDYYWKDELLRYLENKEIKPVQFKREIERKGFEERSIGFYTSWSDINKMPIAPQSPKFILKVGQMLNNQKITDNYLSYFEASKNVKKMFSGDREAYLNFLVDRNLDDFTTEKYIKEIVISIDNIEIPNISRRITNKIWREG